MGRELFHTVIKAKYTEKYCIWVAFDDGTSGTVDFSEWQPFTGVLCQIESLDVFKQFFIKPETKTIAWPTPDEVDADPIWLYCRANNLTLPGAD